VLVVGGVAIKMVEIYLDNAATTKVDNGNPFDTKALKEKRTFFKKVQSKNKYYQLFI
jgi:hypothetical protein